MISLDLGTGESKKIGEVGSGGEVQGIGYNHLDNYIYGCERTTTASTPTPAPICRVIRIGADAGWSYMNLTVPTGNISTGDVDQSGHLWLASGQGGVSDRGWYEIDLTASPPVLVRSGTLDLDVQDSLTDWAYIPGGGNYLYGVAGTTGTLKRFNLNNQSLETVKSFPASENGYGAAFAGSDGVLYFMENNTGNIFKIPIAPTLGEMTTFAKGPSAVGIDGARCIDSPVL